MKVATWNVNGLRARHQQLLEWVAVEQPDVLCLQEIKATPAQIPDPLTTLSDYWSYWHGGPKGYSGVSLHFKRSTFADAPKFTHPTFDSEYRIVEATVGGIRWASVYIPNGGKDFVAKMAFLRELESWTRACKGSAMVICGDLNVALTDADIHPSELRPNTVGVRPDERALLQRAIGNGLVDVLRKHHRDEDRLYTWWAPWRDMRGKNIGWRLDFVLMSEELAARAKTAEVRKDVLGSDHAPVVVVFDVAPNGG